MQETFAPPFWHPALMEAFILDWDGVLASTKLDFRSVRERYFGGEAVVPLFERAATLPPPLNEEAREAIVRVEMEGAARAVPVEGAPDLLRWLEKNGKRWCVVSRNCRESIQLAAERCGIALPPVVMSREEGVAKPDPRALTLAAQRLNAAPARCVMVGDFVFDLLGARRVPMRCVLVEGDAAAWGHLADATWDTMRGFLEDLQSPRPLVPWEYRAEAARRGEDHLRAMGSASWRIGRGRGLRQAMALARRGAVRLVVPPDATLSIHEWEGTNLPARLIGQPLTEVLREVLAQRWPAVTVCPDDGGPEAVGLPPGADVEEAIESALSRLQGPQD